MYNGSIKVEFNNKPDGNIYKKRKTFVRHFWRTKGLVQTHVLVRFYNNNNINGMVLPIACTNSDYFKFWADSSYLRDYFEDDYE